jgi:RND family efflux transporter MFP subunit
MNRTLKWIVIALILAALGAGAARVVAARAAQKQAMEAQQLASRTQTAVELTTSDILTVKTVELVQGLNISGPLKAVNSALVKARVAGELQGLTVREGDAVKAGQVIARVDSTEFVARVRQARQQAESAKAQVEIAKRNFDNNRSLVEQGFISKTALESSIATLAAAEATYQAAQAGADVATKSLDDTVLRAPISGLIAQRLSQPGERVAIDARIVEIVDSSRLELEANLSAADSLVVQIGQTALLTVEGATQPVQAKVVRINPSAVAANRSVVAYLALDAGSGLRQGLFAQGTLATGTLRTLALPLSAVRVDQPQPYVQLIANNQVAHQTVTPGARGNVGGETMVAVQGLQEGAQVLSGSVGPVRAGTQIKTPQGSK